MSSVSGEDADGCSEEECCWLCEKPGGLSMKYGGLKFHRKCHAAVLAREAHCRKGAGGADEAKKAVAKLKKEMKDRASEWRSRTLPFLVGGRKEKREARVSQ